MVGPLAAVAAPTVAAAAYAVTSDSSGLDLTSLLGTVVTPVIVILLLLTGKLRTEGEVKNRDETIAILRRQNSDKEDQLVALQTSVVEKAIPALTRTALILERLTPDFRER
jgi:hypothetical protein